MVSQAADDKSSDLLKNETIINVAALLQDEVGSRRIYGFHLDEFRLVDDMFASVLNGSITLTRLRSQILASVELEGFARLECVRCLRDYEEPVKAEFSEPFRQSVDVRSGAEIRESDQVDPEDEEFFAISENHEIDLREAIRQNVILALPMRPDCGDECPGPDTQALDRANGADDVAEDPETDNRFAALSALLDERDEKGR